MWNSNLRSLHRGYLELRDDGTSLEDIAVMYRSHYHSIELQLELARRNIPYRVQSGVRFFEQAHIKDVISYLRIIVNPHDELAWKRILKMIPGIGNKTANRVYEAIVRAEPPAIATMAEPPALAGGPELDIDEAPMSRAGSSSTSLPPAYASGSALRAIDVPANIRSKTTWQNFVALAGDPGH